MMLTLSLAVLALAYTAQGAGISFPDLRGGVLLSAFPGLSPPGQSWGNCHNEQGNRFRDPRAKCCIDALKDKFGYEENVAKELLRLASQGAGARPPTVPQGSYPTSADLKSRKAMCIVADECSCKLTQDWCTDRSSD